MAEMPKSITSSATVEAIYAAYEKANESRQSNRLGASQIGRPCGRQLWYSFRHCGSERFDGRMLRLFSTGHHEEPRIINDLRSIGCEAYDVDPETGEQFTFTAHAGHFVCKIDGVALGVPEAPKTWHVCEFKTASAKQFAKIQSSGIKEAKPEHYSQCLMGMLLSGMKRALYIVKNKDTDHLYSERLRIEHCRDDAAALMERAESIISANTPPERISDKPDGWFCRYCSFKDLCHGAAEQPGPAVPCTVSCRNCVHATPEMDTDHGRWSCAKHNKSLSRAEQAAACPDHLFIPDLVTFAQPIDSGTDLDQFTYIEYRNLDGTTWRNGAGPHHYGSEELTKLPGPLVGQGLTGEAKRVFDCTVEGVEVETA